MDERPDPDIAINTCDTDSEDSDSSEDDSVSIVLEVLRASKNFNKEKPCRIYSYVERTIPGYSEKQFQEHFRVTRSIYELLLQRIGPTLLRKASVGRQTISVERQILSVIWLLGTPDSYRSVADRFNMGKSSLSVSFFRVVEALCQISEHVIVWPTGDRRQEICQKFKAISRLDNVIGAIDGTYINIKAPKKDPEVYVTRKYNYAITLQAVCDPDLRFTDVFVGYPGSVSDTRIFRNSDLFQAVQQTPHLLFQNQDFIIGDKAYPIIPWCIPPYIEHARLNNIQKNFNTIHAQTRQVIERSFALLFGRFRRLKFIDMNNHDMIPFVVVAACLLHNMCLCTSDNIFTELYINDGTNNVNRNDNIDINELQIDNINEAKHKRNTIAQILYDERQ